MSLAGRFSYQIKHLNYSILSPGWRLKVQNCVCVLDSQTIQEGVCVWGGWGVGGVEFACESTLYSVYLWKVSGTF